MGITDNVEQYQWEDKQIHEHSIDSIVNHKFTEKS